MSTPQAQPCSISIPPCYASLQATQQQLLTCEKVEVVRAAVTTWECANQRIRAPSWDAQPRSRQPKDPVPRWDAHFQESPLRLHHRNDAAASCTLGRSVLHKGLGVCVGVRIKWRGGPGTGPCGTDAYTTISRTDMAPGSPCETQRSCCLDRWLLVFRCASVGSAEGGSGDG